MISFSTAKILVVCLDSHDKEYLHGFFERIEGMQMPEFVVEEFPLFVDKYDFIVFSGYRMGAIANQEQFNSLPELAKDHFAKLDYYTEKSSKNIVYFGKYYWKLNQERCASANSKFSLFARMRELVDYVNSYRE